MKITMEVGKEFPEITGANADAFAQELLKIEDSEFSEVILDFSETKAISSMAMGSLFATYQKLSTQKRNLKVINPSENIERLLRLVNMSDLIQEAEETE